MRGQAEEFADPKDEKVTKQPLTRQIYDTKSYLKLIMKKGFCTTWEKYTNMNFCTT